MLLKQRFITNNVLDYQRSKTGFKLKKLKTYWEMYTAWPEKNGNWSIGIVSLTNNWRICLSIKF